MKKLLLLTSLLCFATLGFSQQVAKNLVVVEIVTGTWCVNCPASARGAHDLLSNGKSVAIVEHHGGDS